MIQFTVPGTPVGKGRPRIGRIGAHARMFTPAKTVSYEQLVARLAALAMRGQAPLEGPVWANVYVAMPIPASWSKKKQELAKAGVIRPCVKPDGDNVLKAIFDGMNGIVWKDDVQWCDGRYRKQYSATPRVVVQFWPIVPKVLQQELPA